MSGRDADDVILLEGVQVPAALGVTAAERRMRRPVRIDLEIGRSLAAAGRSDRIGDTIDYGEIYRVVEEVASGQEHRLVEALGERVAQALLEGFAIDWVEISVRKPKPIAGVLDHTGVRLLRRRNG
ncbi:MAG: dihydroneopterin aldolase [Deltaproteobacteria bacterium]|nr:dihydroneopterin aldolase [Deltaproteobacteria bacterium]MBW2695047.1 dihydroneopterin aldolase [Deltaproteobacteria bacterium]